MFLTLLFNREFKWCFSLIRDKLVAQNEVNVQAELANKTDNHTVSYKHRTGRTLI